MKTYYPLIFVIVSLCAGCSVLGPESDEHSSSSSGYRLASYTERFRDGSVTEMGTYSYSEDGLLEKLEIDLYRVDGTVSSTLTITFGHDDQGRLSSRRHVNSLYTNDPVSYSYLYDENGRLERIRLLYRLSTSYPGENYVYDSDGRLVAFEDGQGPVQVNWQDGRIVSRIGNSDSTAYLYNASGQCIEKRVTTSMRTGRETFAYNESGLLTSSIYYDDLGPALTKTLRWEPGQSGVDFTDIENSIKYQYGWF